MRLPTLNQTRTASLNSYSTVHPYVRNRKKSVYSKQNTTGAQEKFNNFFHSQPQKLNRKNFSVWDFTTVELKWEPRHSFFNSSFDRKFWELERKNFLTTKFAFLCCSPNFFQNRLAPSFFLSLCLTLPFLWTCIQVLSSRSQTLLSIAQIWSFPYHNLTVAFLLIYKRCYYFHYQIRKSQLHFRLNFKARIHLSNIAFILSDPMSGDATTRSKEPLFEESLYLFGIRNTPTVTIFQFFPQLDT